MKTYKDFRVSMTIKIVHGSYFATKKSIQNSGKYVMCCSEMPLRKIHRGSTELKYSEGMWLLYLYQILKYQLLHFSSIVNLAVLLS